MKTKALVDYERGRGGGCGEQEGGRIDFAGGRAGRRKGGARERERNGGLLEVGKSERLRSSPAMVNRVGRVAKLGGRRGWMDGCCCRVST